MAYYSSSFYKPGQPLDLGLPTPTPTPISIPAVAPISTPVQNSLPVSQPTRQSQTEFTPINKPNTFFTGNWFDRTMDIIGIPGYARAGLMKGGSDVFQQQRSQLNNPKGGVWDFNLNRLGQRLKGGIKNIIPAIQQRTAISSAPGDFDTGKLLGLKGGAADIYNAFETLAAPVLPLAGIAKLFGKVPGVTKAGKVLLKGGEAVTDIVKKTPGLSKVIETINPYFRNPKVGKLITESEQKTKGRVAKLAELLQKEVKNLKPEEQRIIGDAIDKGKIIGDVKLDRIVQKMHNLSERIGREALEVGLLTKKSYKKFKGHYLTRIWKEAFEDKRGLFSGLKSLVPKVIGTYFKKRRDKKGYLREFAPVVFKGLGTEIKDIGAVKLYKMIGSKFGSKIEKGKDLIPDLIDAGKEIKSEKVAKYFKNVGLSPEIVDYINRIGNLSKPGFWGKALNVWKAGKTIYNPAYHIRNLVSNQILSDMQTGRGLSGTIYDYLRSLPEFFGKGNQKFAKVAQRGGLIKSKSFYQSTEDLLQHAGLKKENLFKKIAVDFPRQLQIKTEETAKYNVFKTLIKNQAKKVGTSVDNVLKNKNFIKTAIDKAEKAIFSPYLISSAERASISNIIPFYSFTRQALPFTIKTLLKHPERLVKYPRWKQIIENQTRSEQLPTNLANKKTKDLIRLPIKKDDKMAYFDPTYTYPWGNFMEQKSIFPFGLSFNPFVSELFQQYQNKDFYSGMPITERKVYKERLRDKLTHLRRTLAPTLFNTIVDKLIPTFQGKPDYTGMERSKGQAILDTLGFKIKTYNTQKLRSQSESNIKREEKSYVKDQQSIEDDMSLDEITRTRKLKDLRIEYDKFLNSIR